MKYIYCKYQSYLDYIKDNKYDNLLKNIKIYPSSNKFINLNKINEIFKNPLETEYDFFIVNDDQFKIVFKTNSGNEYRLDLYNILEYNDYYNHISFTINDDKFDIIPTNQEDWESLNKEYSKLTDNKEMIEILNRISYILKDLINTDKISNKLAVGLTELDKKNRIYQYLLDTIGAFNISKRKSNVYPDTGFSLYFEI